MSGPLVPKTRQGVRQEEKLGFAYRDMPSSVFCTGCGVKTGKGVGSLKSIEGKYGWGIEGGGIESLTGGVSSIESTNLQTKLQGLEKEQKELELCQARVDGDIIAFKRALQIVLIMPYHKDQDFRYRFTGLRIMSLLFIGRL